MRQRKKSWKGKIQLWKESEIPHMMLHPQTPKKMPTKSRQHSQERNPNEELQIADIA